MGLCPLGNPGCERVLKRRLSRTLPWLSIDGAAWWTSRVQALICHPYALHRFPKSPLQILAVFQSCTQLLPPPGSLPWFFLGCGRATPSPSSLFPPFVPLLEPVSHLRSSPSQSLCSDPGAEHSWSHSSELPVRQILLLPHVTDGGTEAKGPLRATGLRVVKWDSLPPSSDPGS